MATKDGIKIRSCIRRYSSKEFSASCITFNLFGCGESVEEAKEDLLFLIRDHLEDTVIDYDDPNKLSICFYFLNRSAPLFMYRDYIICLIFKYIFKSKKSFTFTNYLSEIEVDLKTKKRKVLYEPNKKSVW